MTTTIINVTGEIATLRGGAKEATPSFVSSFLPPAGPDRVYLSLGGKKKTYLFAVILPK